MMERKQLLELFHHIQKNLSTLAKAASRKAASLWAISLLSLQIKTFFGEARRWKFPFITLSLSRTHHTHISLGSALHFVARLFSSTRGERERDMQLGRVNKNERPKSARLKSSERIRLKLVYCSGQHGQIFMCHSAE